MSIAQDVRPSRNGRTKPHPLSDPDVYLRHAEFGWYIWLRAAIEYPVTLCLLVLTFPVMAFSALLIKLTSRGPMIYSQVRLGRGGQPFKVYKIRSMYHDCERSSGPRWSNGRDPRVLPIGRIIRILHIDELPQLWNVLRGEMSLIGPRPERPEFVLKLERSVPRYRDRLRVRPGITGLAQVQLPADIDLEGVRKKLAYDLYYIDGMAPWLDFRITLATILKMAGVPFSTLRRLFSMPDPSHVDALYWQKIPFTENLPRLEIQTA
jgi:lipopolysaccharide/colanic/teichoic acid biosynthesis glycosyltransferase